jgi:hypothetical protein
MFCCQEFALDQAVVVALFLMSPLFRYSEQEEYNDPVQHYKRQKAFYQAVVTHLLFFVCCRIRLPPVSGATPMTLAKQRAAERAPGALCKEDCSRPVLGNILVVTPTCSFMMMPSDEQALPVHGGDAGKQSPKLNALDESSLNTGMQLVSNVQGVSLWQWNISPCELKRRSRIVSPRFSKFDLQCVVTSVPPKYRKRQGTQDVWATVNVKCNKTELISGRETIRPVSDCGETVHGACVQSLCVFTFLGHFIIHSKSLTVEICLNE